MPHYKLLFPRDYVGACDLEKGEKVVVIERIKVEELKSVRGKSDIKPIVYFKGAKKKMVLNKTNGKTIAGIYGTNTDDWIGKAITLYATTCSGQGGEEVECIRVRPGEPRKSSKSQPEPEGPETDPDTGEVVPDGVGVSAKDRAIDESEPGLFPRE